MAAAALVVGSCGRPAAPTSPSTTAPPAPSTTSVADTTTSTSPPSPSTPEEVPELDRSLLSLGLAPNDDRPGRFQLVPGIQSDYLMSVEGRYWATTEGNVYTALDVDVDSIELEMERLVAAVEQPSQSANNSFVELLRAHYRGNEFQIGLTDLVKWVGLGGLTAEWIAQWQSFIESEGVDVPDEVVACADAIAAFDDAAKAWVHGQTIDLTVGAWEFPVDAWRGALADEFAAMSPCAEIIDGLPEAEMLIELTTAADRRTIEVLVDDGIYTDREPELLFAIHMRPDADVGNAPQPPDPAPLLTLQNTYLVAIGVCGELPWIYTNFAAADTYYEPLGAGYNGPTILDSNWFCEEQVPESDRNE